MPLVHYKFKSSLEYSHVTFDGQEISVGDLKKEIFAQQRFRRGACELQFTDAHTGAAYKNGDVVTKNSSITVMRVPREPRAPWSREKAWEAFKKEAAKSMRELASAKPETKVTAESKRAFYRPKEGEKEHPPFLPQPKRMKPEKLQAPPELKCPVCNELMDDAAIVSCCGYSFCDQCIRDTLLEAEDHQCPTCGQDGVSPTTGIIPNLSLRIAVAAFKNGGGYSQIRRR